MNFKALLLEAPGQARIAELGQADLPPGEVLIKVHYSSLNYKDGLAITAQAKVIRQYPMVPGIDLVGTVLRSASPQYQAGDQVILTGWGVGERHWGGMAGLASAKAEWLVPLPAGLSPLQAMALGTAGLTAMLAVMALEENHPDKSRDAAVTGAAGGVGSLAVALLAQQGYRVVAFSGRTHEAQYLQALGASEVQERHSLSQDAKPLESERFGAAIDTVGGAMLAGLLPRMAYGGSVAACGNAGGFKLETTVFPFILRGVKLLGIDSVQCPVQRRRVAWQRLSTDLPLELLSNVQQIIGLEEVPAMAQAIVNGQVRGRVVVAL